MSTHVRFSMYDWIASELEKVNPATQHHMGLNARKPDFVVSEHQRRRPAFASAQTDHAFIGKYCIQTCYIQKIQYSS